ncbi:substance-P receptor-like, partial [Physella acuta]|uniref:substance-P receptor-like n=1 Tax=Physella acuta TaxID=109671 RepID=UPI0027DB0DA4
MTSFLPVEERIVLVMPDDLPFNASLLGHNDTNSSSGNSTEEIIDYSWSFEFSVILASILSVAAFCIIVGNCMVLMVIVRHRGMRTRTNLFLVNLAVADLFVGLFVVPFTITTLVENKWIFGDGIVCKFNGWMNSFCLISSIHTLMYISIHKYYSIVRPLSNPLKLSYIIGMMAAAWVWAGVCSTMNIMGLKVEYKPGTSQCGPRYPDDVQSFIIHGILQVTVILIPLIILVFCYTRMFQEIKKHSDRLRTNSTVAEDLILTQQKKVAVTLLIVLATFVIMALPYHAYANYTTIIKDKKHFSSYLNPI